MSAGAKMPAYGAIPWDDLVQAVGEATGAVFWTDPSYYVGHQMCGINMNSLNRIVSKFVAQARINELEKPIDMILHCPACLEQHIDAPEHGPVETLDHTGEPVLSCGWRNPPHRSHLCKHCGFIWRPADVATNGVAAIKTKGKDDSPNITPLWFLADETDDAQDDVWSDAADAYAKAAGCLRGHLEWRDRIRAAVRVLLAGRLP